MDSWRPETPAGPSAGPPGTAPLYPQLKIPPPPMPNFTLAEFQELRNHATEESAVGQLRELGTDITNFDTRRLPSVMARACLICVNSYKGQSKALGVGPINDGIVVAANHKIRGYANYFLLNCDAKHFLECLQIFLSRTTDYLTIYYSGHGANSSVRNPEEASGYDQLFVFMDGNVKDDVLAEYLQKYSKGIARTLLLNDCCHSGTIWDIPEDPREAVAFPGNIVSFSAAEDDETAKQAKIGSKSQGLFTLFFWKHVKENPGISMRLLKPLIDESVQKYSQHSCMTATRNNVLDSPDFLPCVGA
jgi:hypothetical protein